MRQHSESAWNIARLYSGVLASETRDLAAHIDQALAGQKVAGNWLPIGTKPAEGMFMWGYWREGRFSVGLAYHNVSGGWSDAYGNRDAPEKATHWAPMPEPPPAP